MATEPKQDFDVEIHLLRDRYLQSVDMEIERLTVEKLEVIDAYDVHIAAMFASKGAVRAATDPVCGLPKLPRAIDRDDTLVTPSGKNKALRALGKAVLALQAKNDQPSVPVVQEG